MAKQKESKMTMVLAQESDFTKQLVELDRIQDTVRKLMQMPHYRKLGEEGICAIVARAKALGIHPFEALNGGFHCINGKVGMSTEMMAALARQRGHSIIKDERSNNEICILHGKRSDNGNQWTSTFSKDDAIAAGLWASATWKKYPAIMLYNRAMSALFRQLFPDLSLGAGYVEDELKEITKTGDYAVKPSLIPVSSYEEISLEAKAEAIAPQKITQIEAGILSKLMNALPEDKANLMSEWMRKQGFDSVENVASEKYAFIFARLQAAVEKSNQAMIQQQEAQLVVSEVPF